MVLLGVLARIDSVDRANVIERLSRQVGVTTFSVDQEDRIGILIEHLSVDAAHDLLTSRIDRLSGVLGTWPVFCHFESDLPADAEAEDHA